MASYIARRLLLVPVLLIGIATLTFVVSHTIPADPLATLVSERQLGNPEVVQAAREQWGLDKSVPEQYVVYLANLAQGDMGTSFRTRSPVRDDITQRLPATAELTMVALLFGTVTGVALGIVAARRRNSRIDSFSRLIALIGSSLPVFWVGAILLFVLWAQLDFAPGPGRLSSRAPEPTHYTGMFTIDSLIDGDFGRFWDALSHLLLPGLVLGWVLMGTITRLVRASMLEVLDQDYIRTARAAGIPEKLVMRRYALRNAMLPTLTIVGLAFATLIAGAVLVETVFTWPGIGTYAVESARSLDIPGVMGVSLFGGFAFLLANLATDVMYAFVDPRIRLA
ncbi:MAG: ABC transporter permease [Actinomycetia bacterium]|nr:ABC transporter permease [Actinomycetes bacterium]